MPTIRIKQQAFQLPDKPWAEGRPMTAGEAAALDQLYRENVRNNVDQIVQRGLVASGSLLLSHEDHLEIQRRIWQYAEGYQFQVRAVPERLTPLEFRVRQLATDRARIQLGLGPDEPVSEVIIETLGLDADLQRLARQQVEQEQRLGLEALEELING